MSRHVLERPRSSSGIPAAYFLATLLGLSVPAASPAATFVANGFLDGVDANPGDGVCDDGSGVCTLRGGVMEANAFPGADVLELPAGEYELTIRPPYADALDVGDLVNEASYGDLDIAEDLTIRGAGARTTIIDGNWIDRIIENESGSHLILMDVTVTRGDAHERNEVPLVTGAGGVGNAGTAELVRVTITNNRAGYGGGVFNIPGTFMSVRDSTISHNLAGESGGIRFDEGGEIVNSTISGNVVNTTRHFFSTPLGVSGRSGVGGGVDVRGDALVTIRSSTIVDNYAHDGGGGIVTSPAYLDSLPPDVNEDVDLSALMHGRVHLVDTIVARNTDKFGPADCYAVQASITSEGNNLDGDGSCGLDAASGALPATDPHLGPLADNGGGTDTHEPLPESPVVDAAGAATCEDADQRGIVRPQGLGCDIGAVERVRD